MRLNLLCPNGYSHPSDGRAVNIFATSPSTSCGMLVGQVTH